MSRAVEEGPELQEVGPIRAECVPRQSSLELQVGEEVEDQVLTPDSGRRNHALASTHTWGFAPQAGPP